MQTFASLSNRSLNGGEALGSRLEGFPPSATITDMIQSSVKFTR